MFQSKTENDNLVGDENEESILSVGLLITTSTAGGKYSRLWRRSLCIGIFISLRKNLIRQESPPPTPTYAPCPQEPVPAAASEQLSRTSSSQSRCVIDIHDNEEEKEANAEEILRNKVVQAVKERNLNSLRRIGCVNEVAALFGANDVELGIDGSQDQQAWSTNNNPVDEKGFWHFFLRACTRFSILLLLISAALSFVTHGIEQGLKDGWPEGVKLLTAVVVLVAFHSVGNFLHGKKRVKKLLKNMKKLEVNVVRRGETRRVAISDVVQGDIVLLTEDERVPADGLLVRGDDLEVDEVLNSKIDRDQNPFLFAGSKVTKGSGRMLVTSVGANTTMGKALSLVIHDPNEKRLLQARIEEPNNYSEIFTLCVSVVIALAVLIRLLCGKHNNSKASPESKVNVSVDMLMKIFERISLKSKNICTWAHALVAVVIGIQHGMPSAITASLCCWKKKAESCEVEVRNVSACGTMGLITIIYIDATGWLKCNEIRSAEEDLRKAGVCVKLFSEDELPEAIAIACELGIYTPGSKDVAVEGEETRDLRSSRMIEKVELATVIASCLPEDKLRIIQAIATERCVYDNIQKFIQIQLTNCISGLLITLVTAIGTGTSPITGWELFYVNMVLCLLGRPMMSMELKGQELMLTNKPAVGPQSLLTKVVWRKIAIQVICQASVLLSFQFMGQAIPAWKNSDTRKTMIFNAFLLCQVFYLLNAMDLVEKEVLKVTGIELLGMVTDWVIRLNAVQWASCCLVAAVAWGFYLAVKLFADILSKSSIHDHSHCVLRSRMAGPYVPHLVVPCFMLLVIHVLPGVVFAVVNQYGNVQLMAR
ncbi:Calcium-transporting ATPase 10, plasma membrane-type [Morella rubra]|uniref:Calcium-transporting ATPase 10, plasma membrane-type n=1 Tax=Morella rubra TaxID=262757 RepID=A0A6A1V7F6_9ROSI|nr:Calcium-transporting ATPase 10, plasma membrane-type [Morella rubra]